MCVAVLRFAGFYAIPRFPGDRRAPEAESRGPCGPVCQAAPSARVAGRPLAGPPPSGRQRGWPSVRLAGVPRFGFLRSSPGFRGIDERRKPSRGGPAVCGGQVPPRLGSQGDRSPVPRRAGDSVCVAVRTVRRPLRNPPVSGGSTSAAGRVEGVRQCVATRCPLGSGRRATARRSPAERETAFVWPSPVCGVGHPAVQSRGHQLDDRPLVVSGDA